MRGGLRSTTDFALREVSAKAGEPRRSELLFHGEPTGTILGGVVLGAQFAIDDVGGERLLLVTHDCGFEELLEVYLLSGGFTVVDKLRLGKEGTPGFLDGVQAVEDGVEFEFFGDDRWRLTILDSGRWMPPLDLGGLVRIPARRLFAKGRLRLEALRIEYAQ